MRFGIDIGNVLTERSPDHPKLFSSPNHLDIESKSGAFDGVRFLVDTFGVENVFLVSRCSEGIESRILEWLHHTCFFTLAGFDEGNLRFCRERSEKRLIVESLRITAFIDDRWSVLSHLVTLPQMERLFLIDPDESEMKSFKDDGHTNVVLCRNWRDLLTHISAPGT